MHHNWYIVMHIIYGKVYSLLKLISTRAPFVVVLDNQECVWRHFRSNCHSKGLVEGEHCRILPYRIFRIARSPKPLNPQITSTNYFLPALLFIPNKPIKKFSLDDSQSVRNISNIQQIWIKNGYNFNCIGTGSVLF